MGMSEKVIVLMDNGSLRAEATLQLRALADSLSEKIGQKVHPVSLLHSSKVDESLLNGESGRTLVPFLRECKESGHDSFVIIPLFFGASGALVDYLPSRVAALQEEGWTDLDVQVCETLVKEGDSRVAEILAALVKEQLAEPEWAEAAVAMCDHGTPSKVVNEVREIVAEQLECLLSDQAVRVRACSMERREGAEYDFNEPLLESLLGSEGYDQKVIVAPLFVSPGRHAGAGGDIAQICQSAEAESGSLVTKMTPLVGAGADRLVEVLADRYAAL